MLWELFEIWDGRKFSLGQIVVILINNLFFALIINMRVSDHCGSHRRNIRFVLD